MNKYLKIKKFDLLIHFSFKNRYHTDSLKTIAKIFLEFINETSHETFFN